MKTRDIIFPCAIWVDRDGVNRGRVAGSENYPSTMAKRPCVRPIGIRVNVQLPSGVHALSRLCLCGANDSTSGQYSVNLEWQVLKELAAPATWDKITM